MQTNNYDFQTLLFWKRREPYQQVSVIKVIDTKQWITFSSSIFERSRLVTLFVFRKQNDWLEVPFSNWL